jgi:hypothetical protein
LGDELLIMLCDELRDLVPALLQRNPDHVPQPNGVLPGEVLHEADDLMDVNSLV